jgi:hypothetical protein
MYTKIITLTMFSFLLGIFCPESRESGDRNQTHGKNDRQSGQNTGPELQAGFAKPPREAGIRCWWWWLNSNVTRESITKDLEAMHAKGFSGAMIFDAGNELNWGPDEPVPNGPMFSSPEWTELYLHALREAERLDLKLGLSIQSGWNLGGPGVTLDDAAKQITWSEISVKGPSMVAQTLPVPEHNFDYYRDICVLAYPGSGNKDRKPISDLSAKTGARELGGSAPDCRFLLNDNPAVDGEEDTKLDDIINITSKMSPDGTLTWSVPPGNWIVMRFGYTPTTGRVATSSDNWKGHVLDYLSTGAFNRYWNEVVDPLLKKAGPLAGTILTHLETDSWECGGMNWSTGFSSDFKKLRGYDLIRYLPIVAGKIVENRGVSNAFLADLRKTIAACVSENHYRVFAERAAKYHIGIQPESAGPHAAPVDGITNYSHSDIVMSEFWIPCPHRPNPGNRFFVKQAASAAHIYGKRIVGAESFTSLKKPHWSDILWKDQKPAMDHEYCAGLNMIFVHTFTNSPKEMGIPGQEYFAGTHLNPQVTWWDYSDAFLDYMGRIQFLAQKGKFVADALYYYGDHVPNIATLKESDPAGVLPGYDYDVTNEDVLLRLEVTDGKIVVPGGVQYRILVLPDHRVLSLAAINKTSQLLKAGATILGYKPERLVSLQGSEAAQRKFHLLTDDLWGKSPSETGIRKIGKGRLIWGINARDFLQNEGVAPDFEAMGAGKDSRFDYIHYVINGSDFYFISNQTDQKQTLDGVFRVAGKQPEIWDPVTGSIRKAGAFSQKEGRTVVPMEFDPNGSCFVVFRETIPLTARGQAASNFAVPEIATVIQGPWQVAFDTAWGGPASVEFPELTDWTQSPSEGIRFYSGKAVYSKQFDFSGWSKDQRYLIELSRVGDIGIAAIELNGRNLGIVWTPPFHADITEALQSGENHLKITVVNNWLNRLIGDRGKPQAQRMTRTNIKIRDDWELQESGLIGPVRILESGISN